MHDLWVACPASCPHNRPLLHSSVGASLHPPRTLSSSLSYRIVNLLDEGLDLQDGLFDVGGETEFVETFSGPNVYRWPMGQRNEYGRPVLLAPALEDGDTRSTRFAKGFVN